MKMLNTEAGIFGPFNTVEESELGYLCDGQWEYQHAVIGPATIEETD